ncbi:hypothetical protein GCM10010960_07730 [Arenimonas maotaiensis]|uniref:Transposase IS200-like domain-containing protein n=1 Tax=Arenimonas maotaiensis TaxID=1446479 RepID=A0A917FLM0_9GAMM|nr:transposase [Arenimonas maotaiensis]GGF88318.1 hypothetical protein GCM10010960_07730 [Arenimonas maotaiensis]
MAFHPDLHHRRSIRLKGHDYGQGTYFITVCTHRRAPVFGHIAAGQMQLSDAGRMVQSVWEQMDAFYPNIRTDAFIVMPDHIHGILHVRAAPRGRPAPIVDSMVGRPASMIYSLVGRPDSIIDSMVGRPDSIIDSMVGRPDSIIDSMVGRPDSIIDSMVGRPDSIIDSMVGRPDSIIDSMVGGPDPVIDSPISRPYSMFGSPDPMIDRPNRNAEDLSLPDTGQSQGSGQPQGVAPSVAPAPGLSLPDAVHRFKSLTCKRYRDAASCGRLWQRNYWERIVRDAAALHAIRRYIRDNPMNG